MDNLPRRICLDKLTPAEKSIYDIKAIIEGLGCSTHLTDALNHLHKAQFAVADFVDGLPVLEEKHPIETGWLIELRSEGGSCAYFGFNCDTGTWTFSHSKAIRFARKIDAENIATILKQLNGNFMCGDYLVTEHQWG